MSAPAICVASNSATADLAETLAWLWRLGPVAEDWGSGRIAFVKPDESVEVAAAVAAGRLAGAVVFTDSGDESPRLEHDLLHLSFDCDADWGVLARLGKLESLADYLIARLDRPLLLLPPVGVLRLDDMPGTAQIQVEKRGKPDWRQHRRLASLLRRFAARGAVLNLAVAAEAFAGGERVPLDRVWPRSIAAMRRGVEEGSAEPIGHGLLHLDPERLARGQVEYREFAELSHEEAGRRIDIAAEWHQRVFGLNGTFVAPAWSYSTGALAALEERGIDHWMACGAGPLRQGMRLIETLRPGTGALNGLDYSPFVTMAKIGVPPTLVSHGFLLDNRLSNLSIRRDLTTLSRLYFRRDLDQLALLPELRWIGASEYADRLSRHGKVEWTAAGPVGPKGTEVVVAGPERWLKTEIST